MYDEELTFLRKEADGKLLLIVTSGAKKRFVRILARSSLPAKKLSATI
jgi:hypothetical protein